MVRPFAIFFFLFCTWGWAQDSLRLKNKVGDFIFNLEVGGLVNNAISNCTPAEIKACNYSQKTGTQVCYGYYAAAELLYSKSDEAKNVFGFSFSSTNSSFVRDQSSISVMHSESYRYRLDLTRRYQTVDAYYGGSFVLAKNFKWSIYQSVSYIFNGENRQTGYVITSGIVYDSINYNNALTMPAKRWYLSVRSKFSYDFQLGKTKLAALAMFNLALGFRQEWIMLGLQYYPFKRLR